MLLTRLPKLILPRNEKDSIDSTIAKIFRVIITTAAFSASHLLDANSAQDLYDNEKLLPTLIGGFIYSFAKETELGFAGSVGIHVAFNAISFLPKLSIP